MIKRKKKNPDLAFTKLPKNKWYLVELFKSNEYTFGIQESGNIYFDYYLVLFLKDIITSSKFYRSPPTELIFEDKYNIFNISPSEIKSIKGPFNSDKEAFNSPFLHDSIL